MGSSHQVKQLRAALGPLEDRAAIFVTDSCLHRYLRARNWDLKKAEKMLQNTLKWRAQYKPEEIKWVSGAHRGHAVIILSTRSTAYRHTVNVIHWDEYWLPQR